jgi:predicted metal-dependent peptidase
MVDQSSALIKQAVIELLKVDRAAGEVLVKLPRYPDDTQPTLNLIWRGNDLTLAYRPTWVITQPIRELVKVFFHLALHVIWEHPYRYRMASDPAAVSIATDVAVNQYLKEPPAGTATLADLEKATGLRLPRFADSATYLAATKKLSPAEKKRLASSEAAGGMGARGWLAPLGTNPLLMKASLKRLVQDEPVRSDHRGRGLVPQEVNRTLAAPGSYQTAWTRELRKMLGTAVDGTRESYARFNRRQPYRMDLPGRVSRLVTPVEIYVDQSGSMGDQTVARLLKMVAALVDQQGWQVKVTAFDAAIQGRLTPGKLHRLGGGGTSYAAIFTDLRARRVIPTTPVVILTDGAGEKTVDASPYQNVLWLLTTSAPLSVRDAPGKSYHLRKEDKDAETD